MMNVNKWGRPVSVENLAVGVAHVRAEAGGGMVLSEDRNNLISPRIRVADGCYSADGPWAIAWRALRKRGVLGPEAGMAGKGCATLDADAGRVIAGMAKAILVDISDQLSRIETDVRSRDL